MPPRSHSSSSHSSRSSSSSRSSGSFSRSSSSHSSSSRSSSSGSFGSRSSSGSSRGPSSHSYSSHSSTPVYPSGSFSSSRTSRPAQPPRSAPQHRPRVNQPVGFMLSGALRPSYYYGGRHDYVYYPESWTDEASGTSYEKGYYDENGQHYDSVAFAKNGKYENVVCRCPYCGQSTVLNLTAEDATSHNLQCPSCGGPMEIQSELDDMISQGTGEPQSSASAQYRKQTAGTKKRRGWIIAAVLVILFGIAKNELRKEEQQYTPPVQQIQQIQNTQPESSGYGSTVILSRTGPDSFKVSSASTGDKKLVWDSDADSYYDAETECWLWYNTDVEPALWQYWYEGISSDYGDYGWLEHDSEGWWLETSDGNWIKLPGSYDASRLWYIE